jgi:hypothetical protein
VKRSEPTSRGRSVRSSVRNVGLLPAMLPATLLGLAACGSPHTDSPPPAAVVPAAQLCSYLRDDLLPKLRQEPSQFTAMMTATSAIAGFYQQHNALQFLATTDLDAATELSCPAVRAAVLKAIGQKNLRAVLN